MGGLSLDDFAIRIKRSLLCDRPECIFAFDFRDLIIGRGQHIADDLAIIRLVLDHQNALAHATSLVDANWHREGKR
jgi:hypothetical protein